MEANNYQAEYCTNCGANMKPYRVRLTPMMVHALVKFRQAVMEKGENCIHLVVDLKGKSYKLTRHEWNNFTRERFLALCAKVKDKPGYWLLTHRGASFLNGQETVPDWVLVFRNKIIDRSENEVLVRDVIGTIPYMETKGDVEYEEPIPVSAIHFDENGQGSLI